MLNFLSKLQDRYFILICFFVVLAVYLYIRLDAILQLAINFGVAIIALSQKKSDPAPIERLNAQSVNTDSINDSTVNADTVNLKEKE